MMLENVSLKDFNTFGIDVKARYYSSFDNIDALEELVSNPKSQNPNLPLILGGGSNILFTKDFNGTVLKNDIKGVSVIKEDKDHIYIKTGAGENWHQLVMYCVENNFSGIENLSLIPGNVGASPMQNIGAYGVEIKDVFHELEAFHIQEKVIKRFSLSECAFGYRESIFKNRYRNKFVITSVTYRLNRKPRFNTSYGAINQELEKMGIKELSIRAISQAVINIRNSKLPDPEVIGNAGSFFKNPLVPNDKFSQLKESWPQMPSFPANADHTKVPAGWLIEQCGWKGYRKGDVGCYSRQALVLVNYGKATGEEVLKLSNEIIKSVKDKFGIILEREVNIF